MRSKFNNKFYELYNAGFKEYEHGDWHKAKKYLEMAKVYIH
jgi:outer membrane protein assembly factor BamD (BamD/ComL family)